MPLPLVRVASLVGELLYSIILFQFERTVLLVANDDDWERLLPVDILYVYSVIPILGTSNIRNVTSLKNLDDLSLFNMFAS